MLGRELSILFIRRVEGNVVPVSRAPMKSFLVDPFCTASNMGSSHLHLELKTVPIMLFPHIGFVLAVCHFWKAKIYIQFYSEVTIAIFASLLSNHVRAQFSARYFSWSSGLETKSDFWCGILFDTFSFDRNALLSANVRKLDSLASQT